MDLYKAGLKERKRSERRKKSKEEEMPKWSDPHNQVKHNSTELRQWLVRTPD
jgi:hypothetical protein